MLVMSVCFQRLKTLQEFRTMCVEPYTMQCKRDGKWGGASMQKLVPGDVASITRVRGQEETTIPADLLRLEGSATLNEAMSSEESTPLLKESLELLPRDVKPEADEGHKLRVLFGGTKLLQASSASTPHLILQTITKRTVP
jgi:manganese-transporting P-type ATPase